jgi:general secretion pathway protein C
MLRLHLNPPTLLTLLTCVSSIFVITLGYTAWQWTSDWHLAHEPLLRSVSVQANDETAARIAAIAKAHLFGGSPSAGSVPVSNLQMVITGIVNVEKTSPSLHSKVYISIAGEPSKIYHVGDTLPYGVTIHEIKNETVIFNNGGRLEKLSLGRQKLIFKHPKRHVNND